MRLEISDSRALHETRQKPSPIHPARPSRGLVLSFRPAARRNSATAVPARRSLPQILFCAACEDQRIKRRIHFLSCNELVAHGASSYQRVGGYRHSQVPATERCRRCQTKFRYRNQLPPDENTTPRIRPILPDERIDRDEVCEKPLSGREALRRSQCMCRAKSTESVRLPCHFTAAITACGTR